MSILSRLHGSGTESSAENGDDGFQPLPFSVHYALRYRDGEIGAEEIRSIAMQKQRDEMAYYLLLKSIGQQLDQDQFLETLIEFMNGVPAKEQDIEGIAGSERVDGHKVEIVSEMTYFGDWKAKYEATWRDLSDKGQTPFLLAHSTLVGLPTIGSHHDRYGIVVPNWYEEDVVGFFVDGDEVAPLAHDFDRPEGATIVDDTLNTGKNMRGAVEFWNGEVDTAVVCEAAIPGIAQTTS